MGSHSQLLPSNMKGVGGIPPPLSECLLQDVISRPLWNQMHDGLKVGRMHQSLCVFYQGLILCKDATRATLATEGR